MRKKQYRYITIWQDDTEPEIIYGAYSPNLSIDLDIAKELVENRMDFSGEKKAYHLIDLSNLNSVTKEAREYMSNPETGSKGILAGAFISNRVLTNVIINLFFKINSPKVPARFFTDRDKALAWLKELINGKDHQPI